MMDEDDLPRSSRSHPEKATLADSVGELFGALIQIAIFFAAAGSIGYFLILWLAR